jgi:hypothetical protein
MVQRILLGISLLVLFGCAQVGTLTGGGRDVKAPEIISSTPTMGALNINPTLIRLQFDEYIELKNPIETFRLEPADANITVVLTKKTVMVTLKGELNPNTTYSLYIDGGVKDISEGNDSVYQFVFSTGSTLDSAKQVYRIGNAYSKKSMTGVTVGLYASDTSAKPRYLTKSNEEGWASLEYLPVDSFYVKAFLDLNRNGLIDVNEPQDISFKAGIPTNDSLALLLSTPRELNRMHSFKVLPPKMLTGHLPEEIALRDVRVNGQLAPMYRVGRDSIAISLGPFEPGALVVSIPLDSVSVLYTEKEKATPLKLQVAQPCVGPSILLTGNTFFDSLIELNSMYLMRADSSKVPIKSALVDGNRIQLVPQTWTAGKLKLVIGPNAIQGLNGNKVLPTTLDLVCLGEAELGTLMVTFKNNPSGKLLLLEKDGKTVASSYYLPGAKNQDSFDHLVPGEYQAVLIDDLNGNGVWDAIRPETKEAAEPVQRYTKIPKVRANWEVEISID